MTQRANSIVVTSFPVFFHGPAREFEILGDALIIFRLVNQLDNIADLVVSLRRQHFHVVMSTGFGRKLLDEIGDREPELLCLLVLIGRCAGTA